jgi:hypothetical protein
VERIFDKDFLFNWTVNPDKPGLADFILFILKYVLITLVLFAIGFSVAGNAGVIAIGTSAVLVPSIIEEQARVFWTWHAQRKLRAGLLFAMFIALMEFVERVVYLGVARDVSSIAGLASARMVPTAFHFLLSVFAYILIVRGVSVGRVWMSCALAHALYNALATT